MKIMMAVVVILGMNVLAFAHEHALTPEMRRQHNAMSVTEKQWAACKKNLASGNLAAAGKALGQVQKASAGLEKFKLHRNADKMDEFNEQGRSFRNNLARLADVLKAKKRGEVSGLVEAIDNSCTQCHEAFR